MPQSLPATLTAPGYANQAIGFQVLTLGGAAYSAISSAVTVIGPSNLGNWRATSAVSAPDSGGYLIWGVVAGSPLAFTTIFAIAPIPPVPPGLSPDPRLDFLDRPLGSLAPRPGWPPGPLAGYPN